jgi:hypothetical protein
MPEFLESGPPLLRAAEPVELAYLAGVVDSDGYITSAIYGKKGKTYYAAQVGITGTRPASHELAAEIFGGSVKGWAVKGGQPGRDVQYLWQRHGRRATPVLESLMPYLRIKRENAELALYLQGKVDEMRFMRSSDDPYPWFGSGFDPVVEIQTVAAEIRDLNQRTTRSRV